MSTPTISAADLAGILGAPIGPTISRSAWVSKLVERRAVPHMGTDEMLYVAAESPDGPVAAIRSLVAALRIRHADDDTTLAALAALQHVHLESLAGLVRGR